VAGTSFEGLARMSYCSQTERYVMECFVFPSNKYCLEMYQQNCSFDVDNFAVIVLLTHCAAKVCVLCVCGGGGGGGVWSLHHCLTSI
jgi:hypothetical protein